MREWKTINHANGHPEKAGSTILISDNLDFKPKIVTKIPKTVTKYAEGHYIIIKGL